MLTIPYITLLLAGLIRYVDEQEVNRETLLSKVMPTMGPDATYGDTRLYLNTAITYMVETGKSGVAKGELSEAIITYIENLTDDQISHLLDPK